MFSAAEMQLIRDHCPTDYDNLLRSLSIEIPDWSGDELRTFEDIDDRLTKKLCAEMKSESLFDGYTKLLKLGGVPYDYSETHHQLLGMVVANREKILRGLENLPKFVEVNAPQSSPQTKTRTITKRVPSTGKIIFGAILIVVGLVSMFVLGIGGIIAAILGAAAVIVGIRGEIVTESVAEKISEQPATVRKEVKAPFTPEELQKIFDALSRADKIVRTI